MKPRFRAARPGVWALAAVLCAALSVPAPAAGAEGSIALHACAPTEEALPLAGDGYSLARLAVTDGDPAGEGPVSYVWEEGFQSYSCDLDSLSDSRRMALAGELAAHAGEEGLYTAFAVADGEGRAAFPGLAPGLYLLARTDPAPENAAYEAAPLIIAVPGVSAEGRVYDVSVDMKMEAAAEPPPEDAPAPTPKAAPPGEKLAPTGQLNWPIPFLAGAGVILFLIGLALFREAKAEEEKK